MSLPPDASTDHLHDDRHDDRHDQDIVAIAGADAPGQRDPGAEAMLRRIAGRLLGELPEAVLIGRFRILGTLGEGGMGVVYAAEDAQLGREVAIKSIRGDRLRAHPGERARLLREARALAKLSHPNVVQVHEVGEADAQVFIVMELVRGTTVKKWIDAGPRSLAAILACFIEAGRGLDAAHRVGIVHRDFKPSNVLVGADGRVRIADFGLARGDPAPADATFSTRRPGDRIVASAEVTAAGAGTPAYMSPEQILGVQCDARSDQFSFCVALYEAAFGRRPFAPGDLDARLRDPSASGRQVLGGGSGPGWLRKVLTRGLALRPEDRFASMAVLLAQLEATPRRRRHLMWAATFGLAFAGAVTAGSALMSASTPVLCPRADDRMDELWGEAERVAIGRGFAATKLSYATTAANRVSVVLDTYGEAWLAAQRGACVAAQVHSDRSTLLFEQSTRCLDRARRSLARLIEALIIANPAMVAGAEGLVAALPDPSSCVELDLNRHFAALGEEGSEAEELEALLDRARILEGSRQGREAAAALAEIVDRSQRHNDVSREAEALLLLGQTRSQVLRDPAGALNVLHSAYDRASSARRDDLIWAVWSELAQIAGHELDDRVGARIYLEHARSAHQGREGAATSTTLLALESLLLADEGREVEALRLRREVLERLKARLPQDHIEVLRARDELATAAAVAGDFVAARREHQDLWTETSALLGAEHPLTAHVEMNLGFDHLDLGDGAGARRHLLHARAALEATYGPDNPWVAGADLRLAQIDGAEGAYSQAIARAHTALTIFTENFPRTHCDRATTLEVLSGLFLATRRHADQLEVSRELLAIHDEAGKRLAIDLAGVLTNIGESLCDMGRCDEALPYFSRLMTLYLNEPPDEPALMAFPYFGFGRVHRARGNLALALPFLEDAFEIFLAHRLDRAGNHENLAAAARSLADTLAALRQEPQRVRTLRRLASRLDAEALIASAEAAAP